MTTDTAAVLRSHLPENGWCRGCREHWSRLVPFPCTQVEWAWHVDETPAAPARTPGDDQ